MCVRHREREREYVCDGEREGGEKERACVGGRDGVRVCVFISCVSVVFQDEYDELLKYAVVVPNLEQQGIPLSPGTLRDVIFAPRDVTVGLTGQKSTPTAMAAATAAAGGNNNNGGANRKIPRFFWE